MRKTPKLMSVILIATLLAGFFLLSGSAFAETNGDKLQRVLDVLGVTDGYIMVNGQQAWGRFDRGQVVFGSPLQVPDNDWKNAPPDENGQDWQTANNVDVDHPGEEPRYLGFTYQGDPFSNDWFPNDAPNMSAPAERNMITEPWYVKYGGKKLCSENDPGISDYTWGVIKAALADYHEKIGFDNPQDGFAFNPAFKGQFDINTIKRYFRVLTEPRPGITGAVREWHYSNGVPWYDTITVRWDVLPNFIVESIDPGTTLAKPGETYTGTVKVKVVPDGGFLSDPLSQQLYDILYGTEIHLADSYTIPIGVAAGKDLTEMTVDQTVQPTDLTKVYSLVNLGEGEYEAKFTWQVPQGYADKKITVTSVVNTIAYGYLPEQVRLDYSELTNTDNIKSVEVPVDVKNLAVTNLKIAPNPASPGDTVTISADVENQYSQDIATKVQYRFNNNAVGEQDITVPAHGSVPVSFTVTAPSPGKYSAGVLANPNKDMPSDEVNILSGDWPGDNLAWGWLNVQGVDVGVTAEPAKEVYVLPHGGGSVDCAINVTVFRKDDGEPVTVDVTARCPLGTRTQTITLYSGRQKSIGFPFTASRADIYPVTVEAWPVVVSDVDTSNNTYTCTLNVKEPSPVDKDSDMRHELSGR